MSEGEHENRHGEEGGLFFLAGLVAIYTSYLVISVNDKGLAVAKLAKLEVEVLGLVRIANGRIEEVQALVPALRR